MNIDQVLRCADLQPDNSVWHILAAEVRRLREENKKLTTWKDIADAVGFDEVPKENDHD